MADQGAVDTESTVTFIEEDGTESEPIPLSQLSNHKAQATLDVGGDPDLPIVSTFKIAGALDSRSEELERGEVVHVTVRGAGGLIVAETRAWVSQVAFKEHRPEKQGWFVERAHTIKVGDD